MSKKKKEDFNAFDALDEHAHTDPAEAKAEEVTSPSEVEPVKAVAAAPSKPKAKRTASKLLEAMTLKMPSNLREAIRKDSYGKEFKGNSSKAALKVLAAHYGVEL